jgi:hypothetical protein
MQRRRWLIVFSFLAVLFTSQNVISETVSMESLVPKAGPEGWALRDAPETFTKETLFEHIDGQADLFLQYGFEKSVFAVFRNANSSDDLIEVDIYDMKTPLNAFGVFSRFRQEEKPAGIGLDSHLADRSAIFYKGTYFVVLQATDPNAATLKGLAQEIASRIADESAPPREIGFFPKSGLKPGSMEYYPDGLLGHEFLKCGFKASYREAEQAGKDAKTSEEDGRFQLFLAVFENPQQAATALGLFREYLSKKGKVADGISTQFGPEAVTGVDPYQGRIIAVRKGLYLVGAAGFEQDKEGEQQLAELIKEVK